MSEQATHPNRERWTRALLILLALIEFAIAAISLVLMHTTGAGFVEGGQTGIYSLELIRGDVLNALVQINCVIMIVALIFPGMLLPAMPLLERVIVRVIVGIIYIATLTLTGPNISDVGVEYVHSSTLKTDRATYHSGGVLTHWFMAGIADALNDDPDKEPAKPYDYQPVIFQCDSRSIFCHAIYHGQTQRYTDPPATTLTTDGTTISLLVEGEEVWRFTEK
jgi:hypothetical protein